jgi:hypothetical protein
LLNCLNLVRFSAPPTATTTSPTPIVTQPLISLIEAQIRKSASANGDALVSSVAGALLGPRRCTQPEWQTVLEALNRGDRVGHIVLIKSKQGPRLRVVASSPSDRSTTSSSSTSATNAGTPQAAPMHQQSSTTIASPALSAPTNFVPPPPQQQESAKIPDETVVVDSFQKAVAARTVLLRDCTVVGMDCEGSLDNDDAFYLRLVQVGAQLLGENVHRTYVFDMQFAEPAPEVPNAINECLSTLMSSASIVKVFHDLRLDVPAICRQVALDRRQVQSIFDTQVAFEMLAENGIIARGYEGPRASLNDVLKAFE